ncbi:MAG: peptidase E [Rectinema sp.]
MLVLIGGGEIANGETLAIDRYIVESCGKKRPNHLFIPTASGEPEGYIATVQKVYESLGCRCDSLCILNTGIACDEIKQKIDDADIIYVGGGNTKFMISEWEKVGIDKLLKNSWQTDKVISGLSAGSICWFEYGISDSESFGNNADWDYSYVRGLGALRGYHCPHFDDREKESRFNRFVELNKKSFLAIENKCAVSIQKDEYTIVRSDKDKNAYVVAFHARGMIKTKVEDSGDIKSILSRCN